MFHRLMQNFSRLIAPFLAVVACLLVVLLTLSWIGFGREEGQSFGRGLQKIASVVWSRSVLPSPPSRRVMHPDESKPRESYRSWIQTLLAATPILLTGLAVAFAFRASVLNIGAEGHYVVGAIAAVTMGLHPHGQPILAIATILLSGFIAGAMFAGLAAVLQQYRRVPVVLSTLLLNFVAAVLLKALLQGPLHEVGKSLQSEQLPEIARLAHFSVNERPTQLHGGFFIAIACAILISAIFRFTRFGFHLRATGENPVAARFAGIRVGAISIATLCLSGGLAGLAGAIQMSGVPPYLLLPDTASSGYGFTGIAVALLGRLSPGGVVLSALFFGWLQTAFSALETELHVPFLTLQATQGGILIAILILTNLQRFNR